MLLIGDTMLPLGSPAIGTDFIDPESRLRRFFLALEKDNILLIAARRFGMTSIMRKKDGMFYQLIHQA